MVVAPAEVRASLRADEGQRERHGSTPGRKLGLRAGSDEVRGTRFAAARDIASKARVLALQTRAHVVAGGVARAVSVFVMHPVDSLKVRAQKTLPALRGTQIVQLYAGVASALVGQVPAGMLTFGAYEYFKAALARQAVPEQLRIVLAAVAADICGSFWLAPAEVVKQQVQAGLHPSVLTATSSILARGGPLALYQGYLGQISRDVPFRVLLLSVYERIRRRYTREWEPGRALTPRDSLALGAAAGSVAAAVTTPLDVVKTRLMTDASASLRREFAGPLDCFSQLLRKGGPKELFRGFVPRLLYLTPGLAIFFAVYEATLSRITRPRPQSPARRAR